MSIALVTGGGRGIGQGLALPAGEEAGRSQCPRGQRTNSRGRHGFRRRDFADHGGCVARGGRARDGRAGRQGGRHRPADQQRGNRWTDGSVPGRVARGLVEDAGSESARAVFVLPGGAAEDDRAGQAGGSSTWRAGRGRFRFEYVGVCGEQDGADPAERAVGGRDEEHGIHVFPIRPEVVRTAMVEEARGSVGMIQKILDEGQDVTADVVADLVLFLASGRPTG